MAKNERQHSPGADDPGRYDAESDWDRGYGYRRGPGYLQDEPAFRAGEPDPGIHPRIDWMSVPYGPRPRTTQQPSPDVNPPRQYRGHDAGELQRHGPYQGIGPRNYHGPDDRILQDAHARLARHGLVDARDIQIRVENREITLNGTVQNRLMKRKAEQAVESIPGVRDVHNRLRIPSRSG